MEVKSDVLTITKLSDYKLVVLTLDTHITIISYIS